MAAKAWGRPNPVFVLKLIGGFVDDEGFEECTGPQCDPANNGVTYDHFRPPAAHICTSTNLLDEIIITDRYDHFKSKADIYQGLGMGRARASTPELFLA